MRRILTALVAVAVALAGCAREADLASQNLSKAADEFQIERRIVFYNGITGQYMLTIQGLCALGNTDTSGRLSVTCKTGHSQYKKHFLGLSDNVTYFAEQLQDAAVNSYQYSVQINPRALVPDISLRR